MQSGDVQETFSDISRLVADFDFRPATSLQAGVEQFVQWYRGYHELND